MGMHLEYSEQSIVDLDNIIEYIAKDSKSRAKKIGTHSSVHIAVSCKAKKNYLTKNGRVLIFQYYLVFYTTKDNNIHFKSIFLLYENIYTKSN